jgi:diacylglycerol kinase family enzyme
MIIDETQDGNFLTKAWGWLSGKEAPESNVSILKGKKIKINTTESIPVLINSEVVAKTPISVRTKFRALKIIVERDKIEKTKN